MSDMSIIYALRCRAALLRQALLLLLLLSVHAGEAMARGVTREWVEQNYRKREVMIPMRDGIHLYTAVYEPVGLAGRHPIIMQRTPYGCGPYGKAFSGQLWKSMAPFAEKGYIIVFQDVRGRRMSQGTFVNVRPVSFAKGSPADDASDAYDTAEWLLGHTSSNGNIGLTGSSYPGYYALVASLCRHPAIKAVCAQAPIGDWFMGDDTHHNGVLMLSDAFRFLSGFDRPRKGPSTADAPYKPYYSCDERTFFLEKGTLAEVRQVLGDSIGFWNDMAAHPHYDTWWQMRNYTRCLDRVKAAVMVVGGLFDAEDLYGTWNAYHGLKRHMKDRLFLLVGPWSHGGWNAGKANALGGMRFSDDDLGAVYRNMQQAFFDYYLMNRGNFAATARPVKVFFTGENQWHTFKQWPSKDVKRQPLYLSGQGKLSFSRPNEKISSSTYVSDPRNPVPYTATSSVNRKATYMIEDQRFVEKRADVLTFRSEVLGSDLTIAGEIMADLWVSLTGTDADFVVKLIDEFPDDGSQTAGYQMPVRFDIMRGSYRKGFVSPQAFQPRKPQRVSFRMPDAAHTFCRGHRIIVQIQSSWFPLAEMNPQQLLNAWTCRKEDFIPATITLYHQNRKASRVVLPVINK